MKPTIRIAPSTASDQALDLLRRGQVEEAAKRIHLAIERQPDDPSIRVLASMIESQRGNLVEAENHLRVALEKDSRHMEGLIVLSKLLDATHRPDQAVGIAEISVMEYPEDADLWTISACYWLAKSVQRRRPQLWGAGLLLIPLT